MAFVKKVGFFLGLRIIQRFLDIGNILEVKLQEGLTTLLVKSLKIVGSRSSFFLGLLLVSGCDDG